MNTGKIAVTAFLLGVAFTIGLQAMAAGGDWEELQLGQILSRLKNIESELSIIDNDIAGRCH